MRTLIFQNSDKKIVKISALKVVIAFFWLPRDLESNMINKEAYRKPQKASRKPPEGYKKFQGRIP